MLRAGIQILFSPAQVGSRERCGCCRPVPPPPPSFLLLTEPRAASGRQRCGPCPCAAPVSGSRPESGWPGGRDANSLLPSAKTEVAFVLRRLTGLWGPGLALGPRVTSRAGRGARGPPTCTSRDAAAVGGAHRGRGARRGEGPRRHGEPRGDCRATGKRGTSPADAAEGRFSGRGRRTVSGSEVVGVPPVSSSPPEA